VNARTIRARQRFAMPPPPTFPARLVAARSVAPQVRELTFERADGVGLTFDAGQWVSLVLPGPDGELRRSYSIASAPDGSARFDVAVTRVTTGHGSRYLHDLAIGATVTAIGPQGFFTRERSPGPALFVATGTGVTPFRAMLQRAERAADATPTWLLFGVRHEEDAVYRDELEALAARAPSFRFFLTLSQPHEPWDGRRGYVQHHARALYEELATLAPKPHAFVCGLERMVSSMRELLRGEMGLPRELVHSERYD
jgi:CDP-4-dehydro-6-deoxyglucose reductase